LTVTLVHIFTNNCDSEVLIVKIASVSELVPHSRTAVNALARNNGCDQCCELKYCTTACMLLLTSQCIPRAISGKFMQTNPTECLQTVCDRVWNPCVHEVSLKHSLWTSIVPLPCLHSAFISSNEPIQCFKRTDCNEFRQM
jgi:hypothetical protein